MTREERAREAVARAMASKHWGNLIREVMDDDWGVIKAREAIAACLAFADAEAAAMRERAAEKCQSFSDDPWEGGGEFKQGFGAAAFLLAGIIRALPPTGEE